MKLLFHGSKGEIDGEIDVHHGRQNNDFGQGFYTGESYEQAISFVSGLLIHLSQESLRMSNVNTVWRQQILECSISLLVKKQYLR